MPRYKRAAKPAPAPQAPPTPATPWPCPLLGKYAQHDPKLGRINFRSQGVELLVHGKTEAERLAGMQQYILTTWPDDFVKSVSEKPGGGLTIVPTNKWNHWTMRILGAMTNEKYAVRQGNSIFRSIVLTGCGAASKTHTTGLYAPLWWSIDPANSIVVLTSTTKDMIRNRVWNVVRHYATSARCLETGLPIQFGRLVDSQMKLTLDDTSSTNPASICAYAVAHGETLKAIDNLKGLHAKRMLVVIDEANGTPEAIFQVLPNYRKACLDLTVVIIGNPCTRLDPHGRACTPVAGWSTFNERMIEWRTKAVPEWQLDSGVCLRFDGRDSPNVRLGRNEWPYIYTLDNWHQAENHKNTFAYWTQDRGMWPPEGFANTIFTEQLFARCLPVDKQGDEVPFTFNSTGEWLAFLDPAFGGDACVLYFCRLGDVDGRLAVQLMDWLEVPIDPNANQHDIDYQVARRVQQECIVRRVKPECFGLDATGIGRGVGAILASEWSSKICYMNWGVGATERPSAQHDGRPAREVYTTFVGEMWFAVRELMEAGQIRGFSKEAITQFCSREFTMQGKKYRLEPKDEMRVRLRFSPDVADCVAGLVEVARRNGLVIDNVKVGQVAEREWRQSGQQVDSIYGIEPSSDSEAAHGEEGTGWADVQVELADDNVPAW